MAQIDVLPDDALLEIFDFYTITDPSHIDFPAGERKKATEAWQLLVHVCRRWRNLVFESPRRLNLRLFCTSITPIRDTLDVWPALPLVIEEDMDETSDVDNIIAALGHSNRVCKVSLEHFRARQVGQVLPAMQVPFPELTDLQLHAWSFSFTETPSAIPDSFLGGSAPRLRYFYLTGIPFPGLPKLLLSATRLVRLWLSDIPHSGYISPEAIAALFPVLSRLEVLFIDFDYFDFPRSRPDLEGRRLPPPPLKRSILPVLTFFCFSGLIKYLEILVDHIVTPRLGYVDLKFFDQFDFHCPRLVQFFNDTPTLMKRENARVHLSDQSISIEFITQYGTNLKFEIEILCPEPDRQLSSLTQLCNPFYVLSTVEDLHIKYSSVKQVQNHAIANTLWLQLLRPFTALKNLHICKEFAPDIAAALQGLVGGRIAEVLPGLQNIFMEDFKPSGPLQETIERFVAARQLSGHLIAVSDTYQQSPIEGD